MSTSTEEEVLLVTAAVMASFAPGATVDGDAEAAVVKLGWVDDAVGVGVLVCIVVGVAVFVGVVVGAVVGVVVGAVVGVVVGLLLELTTAGRNARA